MGAVILVHYSDFMFELKWVQRRLFGHGPFPLIILFSDHHLMSSHYTFVSICDLQLMRINGTITKENGPYVRAPLLSELKQLTLHYQ